jgi:hypothetical protein
LWILYSNLWPGPSQLPKYFKVVITNKRFSHILVLELKHLGNLWCKLDKFAFARWMFFLSHYGCASFLLVSLFDDAP